jgi:hypothetical protein
MTCSWSCNHYENEIGSNAGDLSLHLLEEAAAREPLLHKRLADYHLMLADSRKISQGFDEIEA